MSNYAEQFQAAKARDAKLASYEIGRLYFDMWSKQAAYETLNVRLELNEYPPRALINKVEVAYKEFTEAREAFREALEKGLYHEHGSNSCSVQSQRAESGSGSS
jgi:hypothetical protein